MAPSASASSTGTTVSAPAGSRAPVEICTASPAPTRPAYGWPAADSPASRNVTEPPAAAGATSAQRSAKPSIAELVKGGSGSEATTPAARTLPVASPMATSTRRAGGTRERKSSTAAATDTISCRTVAAIAHPPIAAMETTSRLRRAPSEARPSAWRWATAPRSSSASSPSLAPERNRGRSQPLASP